MNLKVGSSSAFASKMLFLFSFAVIVLVNKNNAVNATLVTSTTTTTTKTTIIEEYDEGDSLGPGDVIKTNDYHGNVRGNSNSINSNNYNYNDEAEYKKGDGYDYGYATNGADGVSPRPEADGRGPAWFGGGCDKEGEGCGSGSCCVEDGVNLRCLLKEIKYGTFARDVWKCEKYCKDESSYACEEDSECCEGLKCRTMKDQKYGYCGTNGGGKHGDVCDDSNNMPCDSRYHCYAPRGYSKPKDNRPEQATRCQDRYACSRAFGSETTCKYDADCCSPHGCVNGACACVGDIGRQCDSRYEDYSGNNDCCPGHVCGYDGATRNEECM